LEPAKLEGFTHCTPFFPPLSMLCNGQWENAPTGTASTIPNVAYIFDPLSVNASHQPQSPSLIPLHPNHLHYLHRQYWRLPKTTLGGILSAAILHAMTTPTIGTTANQELLLMLRSLYAHLILNNTQ